MTHTHAEAFYAAHLAGQVAGWELVTGRKPSRTAAHRARRQKAAALATTAYTRDRATTQRAQDEAAGARYRAATSPPSVPPPTAGDVVEVFLAGPRGRLRTTVPRTTYKQWHDDVRAARGLAKFHGCHVCGHQAADWANISGDYRSTADYVALCARCHCRFDTTRHGWGPFGTQL